MRILTRSIPHIVLSSAVGCFVFASLGAVAATSPRETLLFDFNWRFHLGDASDAGTQFDYPEVRDLAKTRVDEVDENTRLAANRPDPVANNLGAAVSFVQPGFDDKSWRQLDLPHDWAVELPFSTNADLKHGFKDLDPAKGNTIGWYRRVFELPEADRRKSLELQFDGVFRNSLVWLNGHCLGRHPGGYGGFHYEISRYANFGGRNVLVVRVDASRFEGWFYEGAGIYRHVWLVKTEPLHIEHDGVFVYSEFPNNTPSGPAAVHVSVRLLDSEKNSDNVTVGLEIIDPDGKPVGKQELGGNVPPSLNREINASLPVASPELWSPETPRLYRLISTVRRGGRVVDRVETPFGIRTVAFDAEKGFLLNGKPYVIKGTCNHQDHAGVGSAMPDALQYFRVAKLKEMGSNAYRTSHNPPTPELLDACDRLGMLVMDENRRMDTSVENLAELRSLVLRDRNHPGVFIWSLGNEEMPLQGTNAATHEAALRVVRPMQQFVHQLDPTRLCTVAMNSGWGEGFSKAIDVQGFNYHTGNIDKYHTQHPTQPSIGTETASTRTTRGIYADDKEAGYVAAYGQNGIEKAWTWWPYFATHPFVSGGFVWTGFDYRGEPTPYKWPCISSHFGLMDTCGFPKDIYYYYQAWWTDKPVLHLAPHWNWPGREGKQILVRCFSNCDEVELFVNGRSAGKKSMPANGYLDWNATYAPGVLSAKGYRHGKKIAEAAVESTGAPARVKLVPSRASVNGEREDVDCVTVEVVDSKDRVVPVADNEIEFAVQGGKIIGVGNGDPSSHEPDKAERRKVFNGLAQVIVQPTSASGALTVTAKSAGLRSATAKIRVASAVPRAAVP
jgi:beta-galactosidase